MCSLVPRWLPVAFLQTVAAAMPSSSLQPTLLPFILHFGRDPVPNIRFNVAKALEALAPHLEAGAKHGLVKPALEALAGDPEVDVRYYAIRALAALG
jgi:serine/threonine-protein phosphatase 2A regulatory subunit A